MKCFNDTLKSMLKKKMTKDNPTECERWLPFLLFPYREVPDELTGFCPFELLLVRHVRGPLDILREIWEVDLEFVKCYIVHNQNAGKTVRKYGDSPNQFSKGTTRKPGFENSTKEMKS